MAYMRMKARLAEYRPGSGALTVVLGGMSAGKQALGLAFARGVLHKGGYVCLCEAVSGSGARPSRNPWETVERLERSITRMAPDAAWLDRLLVKRADLLDRAGMLYQFNALAEVFPEAAQSVAWQNRMVLVQDYLGMLALDARMTGYHLRDAAARLGMNVLVLADSIGGTREIARVSDPELAQDPGPAGRAHEAAPRRAGSSRPVMVDPQIVDLVRVATRVIYVERAGRGDILVHTLKAPGGVEPSRHFGLDAGFLAWPPEHLPRFEPRPVQRDFVREPDREESDDEATPAEVPRA